MKKNTKPAMHIFLPVVDGKEDIGLEGDAAKTLEVVKGIVKEGLDGYSAKAKDQVAALAKEFMEDQKLQTADDVKKAMDEFQKQIDKALTEINSRKLGGDQEKKSFFDAINKEALGDLQKLKGKQISELRLKAPGDMDESAFGGDSLNPLITQELGLYQGPRNYVFLRNLLPSVSTDSEVIHYLRVAGRTGAAAIWDGSGPIEDLESKPGVTFNFDDVSETVDWIAGITRVKRQMLDDIAFLRGFLQRELLVGPNGLRPAENTLILNELTSNATAYDGDGPTPIHMLYDAAFGQLPDSDFNASYILMNPRDIVNIIFMNTTYIPANSGLPPGAVGVVGGNITIAGVPVVGLPQIARGSFLVFDRNATMFVSRMEPEIRFFEEDRDNVIKNLITIRAEERAAALVFDGAAIVSGTFPTDDPEV